MHDRTETTRWTDTQERDALLRFDAATKLAAPVVVARPYAARPAQRIASFSPRMTDAVRYATAGTHHAPPSRLLQVAKGLLMAALVSSFLYALFSGAIFGGVAP